MSGVAGIRSTMSTDMIVILIVRWLDTSQGLMRTSLRGSLSDEFVVCRIRYLISSLSGKFVTSQVRYSINSLSAKFVIRKVRYLRDFRVMQKILEKQS